MLVVIHSLCTLLSLTNNNIWMSLLCYTLQMQVDKPAEGTGVEEISSLQRASIQVIRSEVKQRLLLIPLVFILLRISGTLHFFYSVAVSYQNKNGCIPKGSQKVYLALAILQVYSYSSAAVAYHNLLCGNFDMLPE